jgi:large subunit ribosomal protein L29
MKKVNELRNMNIDDLQNELLSLRKEQFNLRMKKANGTLDKTHLIRLMRKLVAKIKTILTERAGK